MALKNLFVYSNDDDFCYKRVQTPGMSPPRAGAWTYCLFTPVYSNKVNNLFYLQYCFCKILNLYC